MGLILDTCVLIEAEKGIFDFNKLTDFNEVYITAVTASELLVGVKLANNEATRNKRSVLVEYILSNFTILPFSCHAARIHAEIYANLIKNGQMVGAYDIIIPAIAIANGYTLLTSNYNQFSCIAGLKIINTNFI